MASGSCAEVSAKREFHAKLQGKGYLDTKLAVGEDSTAWLGEAAVDLYICKRVHEESRTSSGAGGAASSSDDGASSSSCSTRATSSKGSCADEVAVAPRAVREAFWKPVGPAQRKKFCAEVGALVEARGPAGLVEMRNREILPMRKVEDAVDAAIETEKDQDSIAGSGPDGKRRRLDALLPP